MKSLPDRLFVITFFAHIRYLHFLEEFSDKSFPIIEDGTNDKEWNRAGNTFRCPSASFPRNPDLDPFFLSLERKKKQSVFGKWNTSVNSLSYFSQA